MTKFIYGVLFMIPVCLAINNDLVQDLKINAEGRAAVSAYLRHMGRKTLLNDMKIDLLKRQLQDNQDEINAFKKGLNMNEHMENITTTDDHIEKNVELNFFQIALQVANQERKQLEKELEFTKVLKKKIELNDKIHQMVAKVLSNEIPGYVENRIDSS